MSEASLESLFERYRAEGHLASLAEVFDRTASELLALAVHLVRDPGEAEDLVQGTFVAAIEGARSFDGRRRLQPWLAGILARQAARTWRERGRRLASERLPPARASDPSLHAEEREIHAHLARALAELAPAERAVLEPYLAGERPLAIAQAARRAPGTVRMQILRALERLRRTLPAGLYGIAPLARVPRGLGAVRAEVLAQGSSLALGGGAAAAALTGGVLVSTKLVVSAVCAAVVALFFLARSTREGEHGNVPAPPAEPALAAVERPEPLALAREQEVAVREPAPAIQAPASAPSAALAPASQVPAGRTGIFLTGALLGLDRLDPASVRVTAETFGGSSAGTNGTADGRYLLEITTQVREIERKSSVLYLSATHPAGRAVSLEVPLPDEVLAASEYEVTEVPLDLALPARTAILGRVEGTFEPGSVKVGLVQEKVEEGTTTRESLDDADCSPDGAFVLFPPHGGAYLVVARAPGLLPAAKTVRVETGAAADAGVLHLEPGGASLAGHVSVPFQTPVERWAVQATRVASVASAAARHSSRSGPWGAEAHETIGNLWRGVDLDTLSNFGGRGETDSEGNFRIEGLSPGCYTLALSAVSGTVLVVPFAAVAVEAPADDVMIGPTYGRIRVSVTASDRKSHDAQFQVDLERGGMLSRGLHCGEAVTLVADMRMPLVCRAEAAGLRAAKAELTAETRAREDKLELVLIADESLAALELGWSLPAGSAPPPRVAARWRSGKKSGEWSAEALAGGCSFTQFEPGLYRVVLEPRSQDGMEETASYLSAAPLEIELAAGTAEYVEVEWLVGGRVRFLPRPGAATSAREFLRASVLDAAGEPQPVRFVQRNLADGVLMTNSYERQMNLQGPSECLPNLAPGRYELVLFEKDLELARIPFTIVAGQEVEVRVPLP